MSSKAYRLRHSINEGKRIQAEILDGISDWESVVYIVVTTCKQTLGTKENAFKLIGQRVGKLRESLEEKKLIVPQCHVSTTEFQRNGFSHSNLLVQPLPGVTADQILKAACDWNENSKIKLCASWGITAQLQDSPFRTAQYLTKSWFTDDVPKFARGKPRYSHNRGFVTRTKKFTRKSVEENLQRQRRRPADHSQLGLWKAWSRQQRILRKLEDTLPGFVMPRPTNTVHKTLTLRFPHRSKDPGFRVRGSVRLTVDVWIDESWLVHFTGQGASLIHDNMTPIFSINEPALFQFEELKRTHGDITAETRAEINTALRKNRERSCVSPTKIVLSDSELPY